MPLVQWILQNLGVYTPPPPTGPSRVRIDVAAFSMLSATTKLSVGVQADAFTELEGDVLYDTIDTTAVTEISLRAFPGEKLV